MNLLFAALISAHPVPVAAVVITPRGDAPTLSSSELIEAARIAFREKTAIELRSAEQAGVDVAAIASCESRHLLSCATRVVSWQALRGLLLISVVPIDSTHDRVWAVLLDADTVREAEAKIEPEEVENELYRRTRTTPQTIAAGESLRYWRDSLERDLRPLIEARGYWGAIQQPVELIVTSVAAPDFRTERRATLIAGGVAMAGGIVLGVIALNAASGVQGGCVVRAGSTAECSGLRASFDDLPAIGADAEKSGIPLRAYSFGLGSAGVTWLAGSLWLTGDDAPSWPVWIAGLAAGAIAFGVASL